MTPDATYPDWVKGFRTPQIVACEAITDAFNRGVDVVILDAPVGAGKTLVAEMVRRELGVGKSTYIAHSLDLQDQFTGDFAEYARTLKGKANYPTLSRPDYNCGDCTGRACGWCDPRPDCPYKVAKKEALTSGVAVLNTSYMLSFPGGTWVRDLVVVDEADTLEGVLLRHWEYLLTAGKMAELGVTPPIKGARTPTIVRWLEKGVLPELGAKVQHYLDMLDRLGEEAFYEDVRATKDARGWAQLLERSQLVTDQLRDGGYRWVRDYEYGKEDFILKPVEVSNQGAEVLWRRGTKGFRSGGKEATKWLCMSGSIIDPAEWAESCGVEAAGLTWDVVTVPMTWDKGNRPVVVRPIADMRKATFEQDFPKLMQEVVRIVKAHEGENVLVHSVSYVLMRQIVSGLRAEGIRAISYDGAWGRADALQRFKDEGGVIVAPSLDRGVDLPGDLCRVQVVAKMPFLYLGDRQVSERVNGPGGDKWYACQTARSLVQMAGRGVRYEEDRCVMYVLDRQFSNWFHKWRNLLPKYWRDGIVGQLPDNWQETEHE